MLVLIAREQEVRLLLVFLRKIVVVEIDNRARVHCYNSLRFPEVLQLKIDSQFVVVVNYQKNYIHFCFDIGDDLSFRISHYQCLLRRPFSVVFIGNVSLFTLIKLPNIVPPSKIHAHARFPARPETMLTLSLDVRLRKIVPQATVTRSEIFFLTKIFWRIWVPEKISSASGIQGGSSVEITECRFIIPQNLVLTDISRAVATERGSHRAPLIPTLCTEHLRYLKTRGHGFAPSEFPLKPLCLCFVNTAETLPVVTALALSYQLVTSFIPQVIANRNSFNVTPKKEIFLQAKKWKYVFWEGVRSIFTFKFNISLSSGLRSFQNL